MLNPIDLALLPLRIARGAVNKLIGGGHDTPSDPASTARVEPEPVVVPSKPAPATTRKPPAVRRAAAAKPAKPKPGVSADETAARTGVPTPAEIAARGEGRQPAPFGSTENGS
jgi:hypothetical protein